MAVINFIKELCATPLSTAVTIGFVLLVIVCVVNIFKSKTMTGTLRRVKKIKLPFMEAELNSGEKAENASNVPEGADSISKKSSVEIDKMIFSQVVQDCIERAMDSALERAKIQLNLKEDQVQHARAELNSIVDIESVEYGDLLETLGDENPDMMSDLYTFRVRNDFNEVSHTLEEKLTPTLSNKSDEDLKEISSSLINHSIPALRKAFSKYNIAHKEEAREIFEKHLSDVERVIRETLEYSRQVSLESQKESRKNLDNFNDSVKKSLVSHGLPETEGVQYDKSAIK